MGAIDVVPLVPLAGVTLGGAADAARGLGARLAAELGLPVWLYGAAAVPGRHSDLRTIRGDGFEAMLAQEERIEPPDFGPHRLHPTAGAVAVGARPPLIAFNVLLNTDRLEVARRLARRVRESSGGLPAVQALGLLLESRNAAQVTMNLLDHRRTGIAAVLARLRQAAAEEEVELAQAELVGLAPAEALEGLEGDPLPGLPGPGETIEARLTAAGL